MNKKLLRIIVTAVLLLGAWLLTRCVPMPLWAQLAVYLVPYLLIGHDVLAEAWEGIREGDPFDEDFLMALATVGALAIGFLPGAHEQFAEAVFVMLFFQLGELFEDYAADRSRDSIAKMMDLRPDTATVLRGGREQTVDPADVRVGETVVVRPGEKIPLDGTVRRGATSVDTRALTGESLPRAVRAGDSVVSGCVNLSGVVEVEVQKAYGDSTATKILQLVEQSGRNKSASETFIRRFARIYTPAVVVLAVVLAVVPPLFGESYAEGFGVWLYRALTFLVVSCPCALVISVPLTFFCGIGGASRQGILVKGGNYMDTLARLGTVVFDKTGTLTRGVFAVDAVHTAGIDADLLLQLAAHVERHSMHPIAAALRDACGGCDRWPVEQVVEIAGQGVQALVEGRHVCVGNAAMMRAGGVDVPACSQCATAAATVVHVAVDGTYAGHIAVADQIKDDAAEAVAELKTLGMARTVMLTGDRPEAARRVAQAVGIGETHAALLPDGKVALAERLLRECPGGKTLAFVGDGINDAPVLARADVGIAMGALGSDAAIEAADVVLMDDKPSKIAAAVRTARHTVAIARQNTLFAIAVKAAILVMAACGTAGMALAVFGDVGVMVLAVLNATRALRTK